MYLLCLDHKKWPINSGSGLSVYHHLRVLEERLKKIEGKSANWIAVYDSSKAVKKLNINDFAVGKGKEMKMINKLWVNMLALTFSLPAFSEPLVWQVSNGVTEFRITGSIHVGSQALYPLPKEIEHFLPTSKGLIIEADLTESSEVQYPIPRYTSEQVLDKEQKAALEQIARTLNLPLDSFASKQSTYLFHQGSSVQISHKGSAVLFCAASPAFQ